MFVGVLATVVLVMLAGGADMKQVVWTVLILAALFGLAAAAAPRAAK